jgi:hypothetical protein
MLTEKQYDRMEKMLLQCLKEDREYRRESRRRFKEQLQRLREAQRRANQAIYGEKESAKEVSESCGDGSLT